MRRTMDLLLRDWLRVEQLCSQERYAEHSFDTFSSVLDTCEQIAAEKFAPFNRIVDAQEPRQEGDRVVLPACARDAARAYVDSGMLAAGQDHANGGMQLPYVMELAANAFFARAGIGLGGGAMLTVGNANLLMAHGSPSQQKLFARPQIEGQWFGTMCLSEPHAGSSLADITTRAVPDDAEGQGDPRGRRFRLFGNKMWISNGEHDLSENIIHLVLAKIPGADGKPTPGVRGISLFVVPKMLVDPTGGLSGARNDVALAGLNHKLGYRGLPNTLLNFGEGRYLVDGRAGAIGYLVGEPGDGLRCMFHMMNEARIGVGLGAVGIGFAGFEASLGYARSRRQGRRPGAGGKDPASPPVRIVEHADVKRMLLAEKAYVEGGLALVLYCGRLVDDFRCSAGDERRRLKALLELLTPMAKSWPSEWCLAANDLAIQVHGGCGYTRDFPVEQYWRDNRLNMIHEGTHGIHGIDLLGRKVVMDDGLAMRVLDERIRVTVQNAACLPALQASGKALAAAWSRVQAATRAAWADADPERVLANATPYLQAFGHVVVAWLWLDIAAAATLSASEADSSTPLERSFIDGKLRAARYFFDYELPRVDAWLRVVEERNDVCLTMPEEGFDP